MAELLRRLGCTVDYDAAAGVVEIDVPGADRPPRRLRPGPGAARVDLRPRARSWPAAARPTSPYPAGTRSARAGWTCTPRGWRRWARRCTSTHGYLIAEAPHGLHGGEHPAGLPERRAPPRTSSGRGAGLRAHPAENAAREPEIVDIAEMLVVDGRADHRRRHLGDRGRGRRARCHPPSTPSSPTGSPPGTWAFAAATTRGDIEVVGGRGRAPDRGLGRPGGTPAAHGRRHRPRVPGRAPAAAAVGRSTSRRCPTRGSRPTCSRSRWPTTPWPTAAP